MAGKAGSGGSTASSRSSGTARRGTGGARASKVPPTDAPNGLAAVFANHGHDIWGIALVVLAVVSGIAVYAHAAGVVGNAIDAALGSVFGLFAPAATPPARIEMLHKAVVDALGDPDGPAAG